MVSSSLYLTYSYGSTGIYNFQGGSLILKSLSKKYGTAQFNFGGGTLEASGDFSTALDMTLTGTGGDAKIDTAGHQVTLSGVLSGEGGLEKRGAGTLILSARIPTWRNVGFSRRLQISGDYTNGGKISVANGAGIVFGTPYTTSSAPESTAGQASSGTLLLESNFGSTAQGLCDLTEGLCDLTGSSGGTAQGLSHPTSTAGQASSGTEMLSAVSLSAISMTGSSGGTAQSLSHPTSTAGQASSGTQGEIVAVPEPGRGCCWPARFLGIAVAGWRKRV